MDYSRNPVLYVNLNAMPNVHHISIEMHEPVILSRRPDVEVLSGTTWSRGSTGTHNTGSEFIKKQLDKMVDKFCLDYLKANPK